MTHLVFQQAPSPSETVVGRIATGTGIDPAELPPLFDAIDPDALDAMVEGAQQRDTTVRIEFTYCGYDVAVSGGGEVTVNDDTASH